MKTLPCLVYIHKFTFSQVLPSSSHTNIQTSREDNIPSTKMFISVCFWCSNIANGSLQVLVLFRLRRCKVRKVGGWFLVVGLLGTQKFNSKLVKHSYFMHHTLLLSLSLFCLHREYQGWWWLLLFCCSSLSLVSCFLHSLYSFLSLTLSSISPLYANLLSCGSKL